MEQYSTIVIDEAHERSIDTDILLALLREMLLNNADLRVVIMSATGDADAFVRFFEGARHIHIPGKPPYPITTHYLQYGNSAPESYIEIAKLTIEQTIDQDLSSDFLVFLPREEDITSLDNALRQLRPSIVRLLKVYHLHGGMAQKEKKAMLDAITTAPIRRVILATNIAETSLTVHNISHVLDTGLFKIHIYDAKTKCTELRPVCISKGPADQRKGRAGRVQPGHVWRLYSKELFEEMLDELPALITRNNISRQVLGLRHARRDKHVNEYIYLELPLKQQALDAFGTMRGMKL